MQLFQNVIVPLDFEVWLCNVEFDSHIQKVIRKERLPSQAGQLVEYISHKRADNVDDKPFSVLLAAAIDPHVHYDDPGFTWREDFYTGTLAAAFGGVTTIIDMPCTSIPPITNGENFDHKLRAIKNKALIDYTFWGGVSGTEFNAGDVQKNMKDLKERGVIGYKTYLISGMKDFTALTPEQLERVGESARKFDMIVAVHAEDRIYIEERRSKFLEKGQNTFIEYCAARSVEAEVRAIKIVINIAEKTEAHFHVVHLSSKKGLDLIRNAQKRGIEITTETCPHFLAFTQDDFKRLGSMLKTAPPVKHKEDREALRDGLIDGTISFVTTDHAGCDYPREKNTGSFWTDYAGIPGSELMLPFMISEGFMKERIDLCALQKLISTNAAKQYGLDTKKGSIAQGKDADLVMLDLNFQQKVKAGQLHSKGKYTPFENHIFKGKISQVYLRGIPIVDNDTFKGIKGEGKFLQPMRRNN